MENIKIEEKIDFIYKRLKKEEKREKIFIWLKIFYYCSIILIIILNYFFIINKINLLKDSLSVKNISENIKDSWKKFFDSTSEKINNFKNLNNNY